MSRRDGYVTTRAGVPLYECVQRCGRMTPFRSTTCDACARELKDNPPPDLRALRKRLRGEDG